MKKRIIMGLSLGVGVVAIIAFGGQILWSKTQTYEPFRLIRTGFCVGNVRCEAMQNPNFNPGIYDDPDNAVYAACWDGFDRSESVLATLLKGTEYVESFNQTVHEAHAKLITMFSCTPGQPNSYRFADRLRLGKWLVKITTLNDETKEKNARALKLLDELTTAKFNSVACFDAAAKSIAARENIPLTMQAVKEQKILSVLNQPMAEFAKCDADFKNEIQTVFDQRDALLKQGAIHKDGLEFDLLRTPDSDKFYDYKKAVPHAYCRVVAKATVDEAIDQHPQWKTLEQNLKSAHVDTYTTRYGQVIDDARKCVSQHATAAPSYTMVQNNCRDVMDQAIQKMTSYMPEYNLPTEDAATWLNLKWEQFYNERICPDLLGLDPVESH